MPLLKKKTDFTWRSRLEKSIKNWWKVLEERAMQKAEPVNPQRVFWELSPRLPDNCILTSDSGSVASWYARDLRIRRGMKASLSGTLATMCAAVPYAIASKFAHPERVVIALSGDGAMQMLGINGLITIGKYWRKWSDPRLIVLVLNNRDLNMVTWEQRVLSGSPRFVGSQELPDFPYARYAELVGLIGIRVDQPDQIAQAWDAALAADRPVVIEAVTDPNVPSLPPHITAKQAQAFSKAMLRGDPEQTKVLRQTLRDFFH
jgi:pyruvate dehydrogenase (quinone)